jgi:hypothetical protein
MTRWVCWLLSRWSPAPLTILEEKRKQWIDTKNEMHFTRGGWRNESTN